MFSHEAGFAALHVTDHVPFYTTLRGERLNFRNTFFGIILTQDARARLDGGLDNFKRLRLGDDHEANLIGIASAFSCGGGDLVEGEEVFFADGGDEG